MQVLLTGGTGFIGSAVLLELQRQDHEVLALVRSQESADAVAADGATPLLGDLTDTTWLTEQLRGVDAAIHTASPNDETSPAFDRSIAQAVVDAFGGTEKPYVHTSGIWLYGSGTEITEASPFNPPALTAWRPEVEAIVTGASDLRAMIVVPSIVYGNGAGIPAALVQTPRTDDGDVLLIGSGDQHWPSVHTDDLAELYVLALELGGKGEYYLGSADGGNTVRELGEAVAAAHDAPGVAPDTIDGTHARFGQYFGDALLLDQQVDASKARALGWNPSRPSLVEELRSGSYV